MMHQQVTRKFPTLERALPGREPVPSAAAERMRRHRECRRDGLRCLTIELRETEIEALIRKGFLQAEMRNNANAITEALYAHFDRTLDFTP
jgi:hypothetical protein